MIQRSPMERTVLTTSIQTRGVSSGCRNSRPMRITTVRTRRIRVDSLSIALFIAAFTGVVLALQACYTFTGAVPLYFVGTLVGKTLMVELSPEVVA